MTNGLQVVSSGLLYALVRRNGGVSGRSSQVLAILVRDVLTLTVFVALGEAEVDDVDVVFGGLCAADQEVVWLDVSVDDPLFMDLLNAFDHLDCYHDDRLKVEAALASLQEVLKRRS